MTIIVLHNWHSTPVFLQKQFFLSHFFDSFIFFPFIQKCLITECGRFNQCIQPQNGTIFKRCGGKKEVNFAVWPLWWTCTMLSNIFFLLNIFFALTSGTILAWFDSFEWKPLQYLLTNYRQLKKYPACLPLPIGWRICFDNRIAVIQGDIWIYRICSVHSIFF